MDTTELVTALTTLVADANTALTAASALAAPAPGDPVWTAVEAALVANGWTAPAVPELESPAEDAGETSEATVEGA